MLGSSNVPLSRNGKRQACDPCRRRKLACDHDLPACKRCRQSRVPQQCTYYSKGSTSSTSTQSNSSSASLRSFRPAATRPRTASKAGTPTYLGATSVPQLLREPQDELQSSISDGPETQEKPTAQGDEPPDLRPAEGIGQEKFGLALRVLDCIPDPDVAQELLSHSSRIVEAWLRPTIYLLCDSLYDSFQPQVQMPLRRHRLKLLAQLLFDNAERPLVEQDGDFQSWLASFSGQNFRWEALGILFVHWALGSQRSPGAKALEGSHAPRPMTNKYIDCVKTCLDFCGKNPTSNTLIAYLLLRQSHLASLLYGDASATTSRFHAEAIPVAFELGLHSTAWSARRPVSFLSEIRRRIFAHLYIMDQVGAIMTGHPPLICRRYCATVLPLDMSDEAILALEHGGPLEVDENGWNTNNEIYTATLMRARLLMAQVREDILEVALGLEAKFNIEHLRNLKTRQESIYQQLPASLIYHQGDLSNERLNAFIRGAKILTYLEHLQNLFFIIRLTFRASPHMEDSRQLAEVSYDLLSATVSLWTESRDAPAVPFDWVVTSYACPPAGVLCSELLRPDSFLAYAHTHPDGQIQTKLRMSGVVQQLSLLSGFLTSIGPDAPNATLWASVKDVICRTLDQTLNTQTQASGSQAEGRQENTAVVPDEMETTTEPWQELFADVQVPDIFHDVFAFELLDTFDWLPNDG